MAELNRFKRRRLFDNLYQIEDYLNRVSDAERKTIAFVSWRGRYIDFNESPTPSQEVCQDCDTGTPHKVNSPEDMPLWRNSRERRAYGQFAELIELEDEVSHMWD